MESVSNQIDEAESHSPTTLSQFVVALYDHWNICNNATCDLSPQLIMTLTVNSFLFLL